MRHYLFLIVAFIAFVSCNNESSIESTKDCSQVKNLNEFDVLKIGIDSLSLNAYHPKLELSPNAVSTRSFGSFLHKLWKAIDKIIAADASGCITGAISGGTSGALVGAVSGSLAKAVEISILKSVAAVKSDPTVVSKVTRKAVQMNMVNNPTIALDNVIITTGGKATIADSIGYYHNKIIMDMYNDNSLSLQQVSKVELVKSVDKAVELEFNLSAGSLTNDSIGIAQTVKCLESIDVADSVNTFDEICESYKAKNTEAADLLAVITKYVNDIDELENEEAFRKYTTDVVKLIEDSKVDEETKSRIKTGVIVAFASAHMWNSESLSE